MFLVLGIVKQTCHQIRFCYWLYCRLNNKRLYGDINCSMTTFSVTTKWVQVDPSPSLQKILKVVEPVFTGRKKSYHQSSNCTMTRMAIPGAWTLGQLPHRFSDQGWGLLKPRSLISPQAKFSIWHKYPLDSLNHVYIWHVPPQLSCGDTCQI